MVNTINNIDITHVYNFVNGKSSEKIKEDCKNLGIYYKENDNLYLLCTEKNNDIESLTNIQRETNGIIFEKETNKLVCSSQNVFKELSQNGLFELMKENTYQRARVEYCEDGTMIRLYNYNNKWYTATTRCIDADDSYWSSEKSFNQMFWEIFDDKFLNNLDVTYTYIFVLLHQNNRIVVKHRQNSLVYISRIKNTITSIGKDDNEFELVEKNVLTEDYTNIFYELQKNNKERFIKRPKNIPDLNSNFDDFESLIVSNKRGILYKIFNNNYKTWTIYRVDFEKYKTLKDLRGNHPDIRMRYLELIDNARALGYLHFHYPEYKNDFREIEKLVNRLCKIIHTLYIQSHVKHTQKVEEDNLFYRTLKQLHGEYKNSGNPITLPEVRKKIFTLDNHVVRKFLNQINMQN